MHIDKPNVDHESPTDRDPGTSYPLKVDIPVNQDVEMGIPVLLEFEDANVLRRHAVGTAQVHSQLCEG